MSAFNVRPSSRDLAGAVAIPADVRPFRHRLSVAPMMDWTDRHCRFFLRLISRHTLLYTEMVTTAAILHGDRERLLGFHPAEHPLAIQLGGSDPEALAECAKIAEFRGFDEVNLNVGCPSPRVQTGRFGACLMAEPERVADCVRAMCEAVSVPVTVKTRIGIDDRDSYEDLLHFVTIVAEAGCRTFIVHARKAWLQGLSPKENRQTPPLRYDVVRRLKSELPELAIVLNGGIQTLDEAERHLSWCDGVMIGRAAYHNPYLLAEADRRCYGHSDVRPRTREEVIEDFMPYVRNELSKGSRLHALTRHILGLYHATPGGKRWRRHISEGASRRGASEALLLEAAHALGANGLRGNQGRQGSFT
ncbi:MULTISPECIES: tRNA dihydrouridine(20/20a) synthase DusA [Methylococcus]|uniref:tRNA-dihydrouridine(20/20a) synthase n=1 Tax=Methylococcus capsulatus (strain ATCC 33009 / NCIMB 11132 / Bath) TaxID=243233 RepID=Q607T6_METCA|nr:tRNA dihydrouridine(20/20a) synthase DusA [Methylococcus capsulatus]AAU92284.1 TIM-barrel protein, yjbN family [Methylococcus capsulatus str. Bath]QXP87670.1 tRNA dihydrouridine(20/20a) synthase DusA [Methylococcus capsulatus]QXP92590.1 tRNA dihydrouridine(20/20a) synthase DusA [Methylococcus capsulatus]UQN12686.1 tRNA dihydrouridine(20/20a) synthase DusA [Methylococcus capsulatus]